VVSALASINEVNVRRARSVLRWATVSGFNSRCRTFISVCNQPASQGQLSLPSSEVGKWVPASAGKAKAGIVHAVSGWTRGVQVDCEIPWERVPYLSALDVCSRQGAIQIHVYLYLYLYFINLQFFYEDNRCESWLKWVVSGAQYLSLIYALCRWTTPCP